MQSFDYDTGSVSVHIIKWFNFQYELIDVLNSNCRCCHEVDWLILHSWNFLNQEHPFKEIIILLLFRYNFIILPTSLMSNIAEFIGPELTTL